MPAVVSIFKSRDDSSPGRAPPTSPPPPYLVAEYKPLHYLFAMYYGPQRPMNVYIPRPHSPMMYSPGSYTGSYYDHSPEMRAVQPIYRQYSQPLPQPGMLYRQPPMYYGRLTRRYDRPCCDDLCCDRCCDECCGPQCCC